MVLLTALLSQRQRTCVHSAAPSPHRLLSASSIGDTRAILNDQPVDALIIDPLIDTAVESLGEFIRIGVDFPCLPVVFYVARPVEAIKIVVRFPAREHCQVVVMGVDDRTETLQDVIGSVVSSSWAGRVLRALGVEAGKAPNALNDALRLVFAQPRFFHSADDVAMRAYMSRRTLDRWLSRFGLVPTGELLHVARAMLALRLRRDIVVSPDRIRATCGIGGETTIDEFVSHILGSTHRQLEAARDVDIDSFVDCFLRRRVEPR